MSLMNEYSRKILTSNRKHIVDKQIYFSDTNVYT